MKEEEPVDTQFIAENVGFLDNCFDNSFVLQSSLIAVQEYVADEKQVSFKHPSTQLRKKSKLSLQNSTTAFDLSSLNESLTQCQVKNEFGKKELRNWGLPLEISQKYEQKGIKEMFEWQVTCLANPKVLLDCSNLVYSAPTSAGKTLVAEILTIKTVLERQKKVIIILPFVSIVREKMFYLQEILSSSGVRVEGFVGSQSPPGGLQAVHVAICTIEKANSLVNRLLDDGNISELGAVIVDELHLLGDPHRGYILELLLTKIKYVSSRLDNTTIQIVGMSATLPNLEVLANWLDAELFVTYFRPIPLDEYCLIGNKYYDKQGQGVNIGQNFNVSAIDTDNVLKICLATIEEGCSILIFCMTKNRCETLAQSISSSFYQIGCSGNQAGTILRQQLKTECILEVLEQLKNSPVGLDQILKNTISFGVAYHHAGLTFDERDIIEGAFKSGALRVLVATSTLSSGVNLPARKVIIRSPVFQRQPINILTYKQMIGRAGRMGKDVKGESILICTEAEKKIGFELMMGALDPVHSCIECEDKYMRAMLEMIASQDSCSESDLETYSRCTLLFAQQKNGNALNTLLDKTIKNLISFELVREQKEEDEKQYVATSLGKACLSSSMAPNDGISLFCELQKARQCLVLETDLHLIYLVTPYSVSSQWGDIDWLHLLTLWESLTRAMKKVGELVGVQESFIIRCLRGTNKSNAIASRLNIHKRFYTALALQDLVNEVPLAEVATKYQCARGFLQSLQQAAATFAGMVTAFCRQLGWKNMEMLISQFQDRLHFGIHSELLELMKLPTLNGKRARALYDYGFESVFSIASADVNSIENALLKAIPFQSDKERDDDDNDDIRKRNKIKNIWITGHCGITSKEAAQNLIMEARKYLEYEIGATEIKWSHNVSVVNNVTKLENNLLTISKKDNENCKYSNQSLEPNQHTSIKLEMESQEKPGAPISNGKLEPEPTSYIYVNENTAESGHKLTENNSTTQIDSSKGLLATQALKIEHSVLEGSSPSVQKSVEWDSFNFTEGIENITRGRVSDNMFSPNISLIDVEENNAYKEPEKSTISKYQSINDESLFSSEADSLFEESLPIDLIPSKLLKGTEIETESSLSHESNVPADRNEIVNSDSILKAFKSTLITLTDDEEDIKLVYEEENKMSENEFDTGFNLSEDEISTQAVVMTPLKRTFKGPYKREAINAKDQPSAKKPKLCSKALLLNNPIYEINNVHSIKVSLKNHEIKCYMLRGNDVAENINYITNIKEATVCVNIQSSTANAVIGKSIVSGAKSVNNSKIIKKYNMRSISICTNDGTCIVLDVQSINEGDKERVKSMLALWLSQKTTKLHVLSLKTTLLSLKKLGIEIQNCEDISLTEWLIDSTERIPNVFYLIKKYSDVDLTKTSIKIDKRIKKYSTLDDLETLCITVWCLWVVKNKQQNKLSEQFQNGDDILKVELKVLQILAECEYSGLTVDKELASKLLIDVKNSQEILQKKAYKICGYHFNFNSSKDVAKVLGMYKGRKVSTKKSILETNNSPMANIVIFWRKLNSILTKTLYPLTEKACIYSEGNRINPSYTMYTCTGRISMHEPNLQNVPRTFSVPYKYLSPNENEPSEDVIEFNCRNVFVASKGCILVSADYCQLEMRILTHYSGDEVLTGIMRSDEDVFKCIASSWSGVAKDAVDDDLRQKAKQLCYGILYGMCNRTLSQHLDVTEAESSVFMEAFHRTYPSIRVFTQQVIEECRRKGYVETLMKRRRYLPDIKSTVASKKGASERRAVNTTIQGSAADIAKSAMCAIDNRTNTAPCKPRLILQMHDELIYEVPEQGKDDFMIIMKEVMENSVKLKVPLPVKVKCGYTWGSMQEVKL